jgi:asparagine synthase (glutamine-hydrolysing)
MIGIWLPNDPSLDHGSSLAAIGGALRVHQRQVWTSWQGQGWAVGGFDRWRQIGVSVPDANKPAHRAWLFGDVFEPNGVDLYAPNQTEDCSDSLLALAVKGQWSRIVQMDGSFVVALWDAAAQSFTIANDRFASIPLYWARGSDGIVIAGGVRGVLAAPGVTSEPDLEAVQECVTFGGFRLGSRTNVRGVHMLSGASTICIGRRETPRVRRSWTWNQIAPSEVRSIDDAASTLHELWREAFEARTRGALRFGQTLSGGLDSRVILGEAARRQIPWLAITYGLSGCDDERYARRAAQAAHMPWLSFPLYCGGHTRWLGIRTGHVQSSDGLIDLTNLMHLESLELQASSCDVTISGYLGDLVAGGSCDGVRDPASLIHRMSYYGTDLSWKPAHALSWAGEAIAALAGAPPIFALFEHKLPQSIQRIFQAVDPWVRVRSPFLAHRLFDFCLGLHLAGYDRTAIHREWLMRNYPELFARIPWQKTGLPLGAPYWLLQGERARRFGWRKTAPLLRALGVRASSRQRAYFDDVRYWSNPEVRRVVEQTICRNESISCDVFGRRRVEEIVSAWFDREAAPAQVIGSLFVYETYHRDLPSFLRSRSPERASGA